MFFSVLSHGITNLPRGNYYSAQFNLKTVQPGQMDWASPVWRTVRVFGSTQTRLLYIGEKLAWGGSMAVTVVVSVTCDR